MKEAFICSFPDGSEEVACAQRGRTLRLVSLCSSAFNPRLVSLFFFHIFLVTVTVFLELLFSLSYRFFFDSVIISVWNFGQTHSARIQKPLSTQILLCQHSNAPFLTGKCCLLYLTDASCLCRSMQCSYRPPIHPLATALTLTLWLEWHSTSREVHYYNYVI